MIRSYAKATRQELLARIEELEAAHLGPDLDPLASLPIHLTPTTLRILSMLYSASPRYLTTDYLCDILGAGDPAWISVLKVQMNKLRNALPPGVIILSAYGRGYSLGPDSKATLEGLLHSPQADGIPRGARPVCGPGTSYRNKFRKPLELGARTK